MSNINTLVLVLLDCFKITSKSPTNARAMRNSMKLHGYIDEQFQEYPFFSLLIWTLVGVLAAYCLAFLLNWDSIAALVRKSFLLITLTVVATGYPLAKLHSFRKLNGGVHAFTSSQNTHMLLIYGACLVCLFLLTWMQMQLATR